MLTIVYENHEGPEGLHPAWGFSCFVQGFRRAVLFDTGGDGDVLLHNVSHLQIEPEQIDAVVLSHADWDHTGGLAALLGQSTDIAVFMPGVFPAKLKNTVHEQGAKLVETEEPVEVCEGITTTSVLHGPKPEQGLCLGTEAGPVLITGCAHPGIVEMAEAARKATGQPIHAAIGGFHLKDAWATDINFTIARLKKLGIKHVGPCHCSGEEARSRMAETFGDDYLQVNLGTRVPVEPLMGSEQG